VIPHDNVTSHNHRHNQAQIPGFLGSHKDPSVELVYPFEADSRAFHDRNAVQNVFNIEGYTEIISIVIDIEQVVRVAEFGIPDSSSSRFLLILNLTCL